MNTCSKMAISASETAKIMKKNAGIQLATDALDRCAGDAVQEQMADSILLPRERQVSPPQV